MSRLNAWEPISERNIWQYCKESEVDRQLRLPDAKMT